jgi:phenylpyruvate tautomerase PptA (4-oxalocrotonate tautomerase family)
MGATTIEVPSSHVAMASHPGQVTDLIKAAAAGHPDVPAEHGGLRSRASCGQPFRRLRRRQVRADSGRDQCGRLDRDKQQAVVAQLTAIAADTAGDPGLAGRTWVLFTEAPDGGWGLSSHARFTTSSGTRRARAMPPLCVG